MSTPYSHHLSAAPERADYLRARRVADFYARSRFTPAFYAAGVFLIAMAGAYFDHYGLLVAIWISAFLLLWVLRLRHTPPVLQDAVRLRAWRREHWVIEKLGVVLWSLIFVGSGLVEGRPSTTFIVAVICSLAYASAIPDAFVMSRRQAYGSIALLLWPAIGVLFVNVSALRGAMLTLAVYSAYLLLYTRRRCVEYDSALGNELALLTSRAAVDRLSRSDPLTALANRREYVTVFDWTWHQARRNQEPLALLVVDLDLFKLINDRHGLGGGDAVLAHVAHLLRENFRRTNDFIARIGGEEFVVILPGVTQEEALTQAEIFRQALVQTPCVFGERRIALSASLGVGRVDYARDDNPDASFSRIDQACALAKDKGRDRVECAP